MATVFMSGRMLFGPPRRVREDNDYYQQPFLDSIPTLYNLKRRCIEIEPRRR